MPDDREAHGQDVEGAAAMERGEDAERQRHGDGEEQRGERQLQRRRQAFHHEPQRRLLVTEARAEVAPEGVAEEARVLHAERLIEAEHLAEGDQLVDRGLAGQHRGGGVADRRRATNTSETTPRATNAVWMSLRTA